MYERKQKHMREEEGEKDHLAMAAGADPHTANPNCEYGQDGKDEPGDDRHLQDLPSLGGVGGGRSGARSDCGSCKRNFWTTLLQAVVKVSTIILAAFGLSSFQQED